MTVRTIATRCVPAALAAALLVTAGLESAQAAMSPEEIALYDGPDREKMLLAGAEKEGQVTWYTSLIVDQAARPMMEAFKKKYPRVDVKFIRANSSKMMQRIMAENRANSVQVDVVNGSIAASLKKADFVVPYYSPFMKDYPADYVGEDKTWVGARLSWQGIAWNTNLVKDEEAPKTWEALLDPKWKGKLVWAESVNTGAPRIISYWRKIWGEKKAHDYLEKLAKQEVRTLPGSIRTVLDQIIAGEAPVGISMAMHHVAISKEKGAPVMGTSPEPVLARVGTVHVMKGSPHPHAGMLFADFVLDPEGGQQVLRDAQYNPSHPKVDPLPAMSWIQPSKIGKKEVIQDAVEIAEMRKESQRLYKELFH